MSSFKIKAHLSLISHFLFPWVCFVRGNYMVQQRDPCFFSCFPSCSISVFPFLPFLFWNYYFPFAASHPLSHTFLVPIFLSSSPTLVFPAYTHPPTSIVLAVSSPTFPPVVRYLFELPEQLRIPPTVFILFFYGVSASF